VEGPPPSGRLDAPRSSGYLDGITEATKLATDLSSKDPAVGLRAIASLRALLHSLERLQVENARNSGWSWQQIAAELGVSKQAVHEKYGGGRRLLRSKGR
jgi:DNA-directed RNA polymerase specialized sigma24 family protein